MSANLVLRRSGGSSAALGAFWQWWCGQLAELLPRLRGRSGRRGLVVRERGKDWEVLHPGGRGGAKSILLDAEQPEAERRRALQLVLGRSTPDRYEVILRLAAEQVLTRRLTLPRAAQANLHAVLRHQIDRLTPWSAERVLFDAEVLGPGKSVGELEVRLRASERGAVERRIRALQQLGLNVSVVDALGEDPTADPAFNLLAQGDKTGAVAGKPPVRLFVLLGLLLLVLLGYLGLLIAERADRRAIQEASLMGVEQRVEAMARRSREIEELRAQSEYLLTKKKETPAALVLIEVLSRLLPDGVWLSELRLEGGELQIVGYALDASILIGLIENSRHFENAEFKSPIRRDEERRAERFHIAAHVLPSLELKP